MNLIDKNPQDKDTKYGKHKKSNNDEIGLSRHKPIANPTAINNAVERATRDKDFLNKALESIEAVRFPAYKNEIIDYLKKATNITDNDVLSLFESLDGYIRYGSAKHIRRAIEQNTPGKKVQPQISQAKRENLDVRERETRASNSIKSREAVNRAEERKDYPEVTPTAMRWFICNMCGKEFQNENDLVQHKRFESGEYEK
jgi:hypothetical protein